MLPIVFTIEAGVATITLNRPDKLNSFNRDMALLLQEKLDECAAVHSIRCV
jgi:2-(1,2-epoxy-1,2-dihydrophenyl)acetyl-CoA isomerase